MNRRQFVAKAGMATAATALGGSSLGCADVTYTYIPCLGPAAAPTPVPGMKYIKASEIGCALDCDLYTGRNKYHDGAATDDGPRINAAMAGASASNPITLIIDGSALISGLFLPAGGYWGIAGLGCGSGFFVKSGTNNDGIHNGPPDAGIPGDPGPPAPARGSNVSLSNFTLNGNRGNGHNGNSSTGEPQGVSGPKGAWYVGINLMNLDNIHIENVVVVDTPSYHFRLSNVGNVSVSGCVMQSHGPSTDGLHFDGPANDVSITNCDFTTDDDAIALNCPEGHTGNISRVTVTNCKFKSWSLMRLYSTSVGKFNIDNVTVSNCSGTLERAGFLIGASSEGNPNSVNNLTISDCILTAPTILEVGVNFGTIVLNNITLVPSGSFQAPGYAFLRTSLFFKDGTYVGASLSLNNCIIQRNGNDPIAAVILEYGSVISVLEFNRFAIQEARAYSKKSDLITISAGSIGQLIIDAIDSTHISLPVSPGGFSSIGSVSGSGVLATAWPFPDGVMANGVPYISASTGSPSIKINGVVQPYSSGSP
jgi:hypothetical protein